MKEKRIADQGGQVQSQLTEIELYCIAQHYRAWYYAMIGNVNCNYEEAFELACLKCEKVKECRKEHNGSYFFNTFAESLSKLSNITGVRILLGVFKNPF